MLNVGIILLTKHSRGIHNAWQFWLKVQLKCLWHNVLGWVVALFTP
ncbi:hypothetical protein D049_2273 [Vibrio parahaemolyticus VPTS-2010]|nr:hypothetical protein D049_2273 [Vibrio parahaemolyticus VPTS-2010]